MRQRCGRVAATLLWQSSCVQARRTSSSSSSSFDNNDVTGGLAWKSRALDEQRELALTYLGSVQRRVPIHDAVRRKSLANRDAIARSAHEATGMLGALVDAHDDNGDAAHHGDADATMRQIDDMLDELTQDECVHDTLRHIARADAPLLEGEFLGDAHTAAATLTGAVDEQEALRAYVKLRRSTDEYQSYLSIPEAERTAYSAWYLRHIRAGDVDDD